MGESSAYRRILIEDYKSDVDTKFVRDFGERVTVDGIRRYIEKSVLPKHVECRKIKIGDIEIDYEICESEHKPLLAVENGIINQEDAFYWNLFNLWDAIYTAEEKLYMEKQKLLDKKTKLFGLLPKLKDKNLIKKVATEIGLINNEIGKIEKEGKEVKDKKEEAYVITICSDIKEHGYDYVNETEELDKRYMEKICSQGENETCEDLKLKVQSYDLAKKQCTPDMSFYEIFAKRKK